MKQVITDNTYYLLDEEGKVLLKITLTDVPGNQIIAETSEDVFEGPVKFLLKQQ